jgi:Transmembrane amino acid transporter protein
MTTTQKYAGAQDPDVFVAKSPSEDDQGRKLHQQRHQTISGGYRHSIPNKQCLSLILLLVYALQLDTVVARCHTEPILPLVSSDPSVDAEIRRDYRRKALSTKYKFVQTRSVVVHNNHERSASLLALKVRGGGGGKNKNKKQPTGGQSTILSSVFNLVNNVAGAGILTLSAGMAPGTGYMTAMIICAVLGLLSAHCFAIVGEACELTKQPDFKGLWKTTIGQNSAWVVDAVIAVMCLACSIIYSGILGDVFTPLLAQAGFPAQYNGRTSNS